MLIALFATASHGQFPTDPNPDSLNIEFVGQINLTGEPVADRLPDGSDLYVSGDIALMGDFRGIVHIVDISDPTAMREIAQVRTPGPALDIKIAGDLAVIGVQQRSTDFGLIVLDISDPENPVELSRLFEPGWNGVHNLFLHRDRAYLAHAGSLGMSVVDLTDPRAPVVSGFWLHQDGFSNVVHDVFIQDDLAFISDIASDSGGLVILDLQDPDNPLTLSSLPFAEGLHSAWAVGNYVYCNQEFGGWQRRLYVVDITNPRQPKIVHSFGVRPPPSDAFIGPHNPIVRDGLLYYAYYDGGVRVFDLLDPTRPMEIGYHSYPGFAWSAQPHDDGLFYIADSSVGIEAFRFHEPAFAIRTVATAPPIAVRSRHQSVELKVSAVPSPRGISGAIDQVSARLSGDDSAPEQKLIAEGGFFTGTLPIPADLPTGRYHLQLELTDDRGRVYPFEQIYDLYPERDLEIFKGALAEDWRLVGNISGNADIFDRRQSLSLPERFRATFEPDVPFDPTGYRALRFFFHPGTAEDFATNALAIGVAGHTVRLSFSGGDSLAVSLADKRWQTVEIPFAALGIEITDPPPELHAVLISGNLQGTAHIADLALVAAIPPPITAVREQREDPRPANFALAQNFPNPFNAATTIRFALADRAQIELSLYNLRGQRIATLATGERSAGLYSFAWDGRDDNGHVLASGVYLYRLRAGQRTETRKLTLLR
ncbi:MAG: T9SS type A sorting domain-containing protein [Gemmatimonadetes bacterium]|nr:T9SS type A sorting domain-containing protein [Gemmatimonadota bacterium]MBT7551074.1 T9SS type A sorting domain-containing protein [Gemmatimonadota bacterium]